MAMGTTRGDGSQQAMWVATADLPQCGGHPFYERLNEILWRWASMHSLRSCARRSMRGWGGRVWRRGVVSGNRAAGRRGSYTLHRKPDRNERSYWIEWPRRGGTRRYLRQF